MSGFIECLNLTIGWLNLAIDLAILLLLADWKEKDLSGWRDSTRGKTK